MSNNIKYLYSEVKIYVENLGYELISTEYKNNHTKLILKDNNGYLYMIKLNDLKSGRLPYMVHKSNSYSIQNIKLWCRLNNKPFELKSNIYENNRSNLKWRCLKEDCGEIFEIDWDHILQNQGCPYCSGHQVSISNCLATKNPQLASEWHPTKNGDLTPYDFTCNSHKEVWWLCKKEHEWKTSPNSRNNNRNCPYCSGFYPSEDYNLLVINPELCKEWDYEKNKKKPEEYLPNGSQKIWWVCKECSHQWKTLISDRNNGSGCPQCAESKGEKKIKSILKINNINYLLQYTFDDLLSDKGNPLRFDFGILDKNNKLKYLIEFDGQQHYKWIKSWMTKEKFKIIQYHDKLKNKYCQKHNISLLRIPYWEFDNIEKILNDWLNKFNLTNDITN